MARNELGVSREGIKLELNMGAVAREVFMASGSDRIMGPGGVMKVMQALNDYSTLMLSTP